MCSNPPGRPLTRDGGDCDEAWTLGDGDRRRVSARVRPGAGDQNSWFVGWQAQRRLSKLLTPGGEVFFTTADRVGGDRNLRFNLGLVLDFNDHHHLLVSAGRSIVGGTRFQGYLAYQLTL